MTGERKKRGKTVPEELMTPDSIRNFKTLASHPGLHSASVPGILAVDINANNTSKILTGGADKTATVFNKDDEQVKYFCSVLAFGSGQFLSRFRIFSRFLNSFFTVQGFFKVFKRFFQGSGFLKAVILRFLFYSTFTSELCPVKNLKP